MNFTKTGRSKIILGYSCQEYTFEGEGSSGTSWVTDELPEYRQNFMNMAAQAQKNRKQNLPNNYPAGTMLEMQVVDNKGEKTHWLVTAVKSNDTRTINIDEYQVMTMQGGSRGD
jgi:hypothetical protein